MAANSSGSSSAQHTRAAAGRPLWKPRMTAANRNAGATSQKPQPSKPFTRPVKYAMNAPSVLNMPTAVNTARKRKTNAPASRRIGGAGGAGGGVLSFSGVFFAFV